MVGVLMGRVVAALVVTTALLWGLLGCSPDEEESRPVLSGSFVQPGLIDPLTEAELTSHYAALHSAGITTQVLQWTADSGRMHATYPNPLPGYTTTTRTDVPQRVLSAAAAQNMSVYVGLQTSASWWQNYANNADWLAAEATTAKALADQLHARYGHFASFAGWYLPFEVDNVHLAGPAQWDQLASFYAQVIGHLKSLTPDKPVVVAPFFNASTGMGPDQWQQMWTHVLRSARLDVIALQDGVGVGHASAADLSAWFSATRNAIREARPDTKLVSTAETFVGPESSRTPMPLADLVADLRAVAPFVSANWSFSYDHYQVPTPRGSQAPHQAYLRYVATGQVD